jgi:hypothetical protein
MKTFKTLVIIALMSFAAMAVNSCKKCSHCVIKDASGNLLKDYDQKCGLTKDLDDYKNSAERDAPQYGGVLTCTE